MNFRNISAWSIRNPVPPLVIFVALTIAGLVSFMRMDVQNDPDIDFPGVIVTITQPGAAPTELETQVTQRVESAIRSIEGIDELNSTVTEGNSQTFVQFAIGTPIDRAVMDVRDAVTQIRSDLPEGILEPQVIRLSTSGNTLAFFAAETSDMTLEELSWYVDNNVAKALLSVSGMGDVNRRGGVSREIRIILDPVRMQSFGLTASDVNNQLRQVNINAAGGRAEIAGSEQSVRVLGNAKNAFQLGQTQIAIGAGRTVKLADIADVRDLFAEQRSISKTAGKQVVSFGFERAKNTSDVTVYDDAMKVLKDLEKQNPKVKFTQLFTNVDYAKEQYSSAMLAMVEGAVLAVLVVFLFLRDWRATAISALAIPLSAIPAFWFMDLMGFTLNSMTLLGLSLVAGVLVDDAIVEIENIVRHMRMGKSAYQASIDAADEIGLAVLATTMTIVAVFLPVGLMPGVSGQFFQNFGLTVVAAVLMSLAVARLITPLVAAYFLQAKGEASHGEGWLMDRYMGVLHWTLDDSKAKRMRERKDRKRWLSPFADHRMWVVGAGGLAFALTIIVFAMLPFTFQPALNSDTSRIGIRMVPGTTLAQTEAVADKVVVMMEKEPIVERAFSRIDVGQATVYLRLKKDRDITSIDFERSRARALAEIPDARVNFESQFGGGGGGTNREISLTLGGDDPEQLMRVAGQLLNEMSGLKEIVAPRIEGNLQRPEIVLKPRLDLAANLGVTTSALSNAIRIATLGEIDQNSAKFSLSDRQIPIRVAIEQDAREKLATIQNLPVPTQAGGSVPLRLVADIGFGAGPTQIDRTNQVRQITIGADLAPGLVSGQAMEKINALPTVQNLPLGIKRLILGESKWQQEMMISFMIALISGIALVFGVLVLLYRSVMPPFVNMGSLLLAPLGGGLALLMGGMAISLPVLIGVLMLLGIVGKNSILLIDFALEEMEKGVDKTEAIIDAGHKRAQPILMTTVAMIAGMVPTALALSGDGAWRQPMGITVIGGLLVSTVLTLLIVPATFSLAIGIERWVGPRLRRRLLTYRPEHEAGGHSAPQPAE
ncbi:efflux RND transporter permease subunit [Sphingomonas cavernae]|uniref:Efflux RND transporter permease subunit n=1 Tax=Sphingomonas cavernae TaxID=2320861 RepID=A0A418WQ76_9SPHN|nr:efflux RND transporter permease subunit [Sphingomonas cavernae]RJF93309.1 efflux RND transporter permease subunit [Sphingomonas cavernae]